MIKQKGASLTLILIIINSAVFLITLPILYSKPEYVKYLALQPSAFLQGQYFWTIITNMFMHAGAWHLIMNMISLIFLGGFIEKIIGKKRFLFFYILEGIFAALFFVLTYYLFNIDMN